MYLRGSGTIALAVWLSACASSAPLPPGGDDLSGTADDMSVAPPVDLAMNVDLAGQNHFYDLTVPPGSDLSMGKQDLASAQPDLASVQPDLVVVGSCSVVPQSGCQPTFKCTTHNGMVTICDPAGPASRGAICTTSNKIDTCTAGNVCVDEGTVVSPGPGQCRSFCTSDLDCLPRGGFASFCDFKLGVFGVCTSPCDPLSGSGCSTGLGCYLVAREHSDCQKVGALDIGSGCSLDNDCLPGEACIKNALGMAKCRKICAAINIGTLANCFPGNTCKSVMGWTTYAVCCPNIGGC